MGAISHHVSPNVCAPPRRRRGTRCQPERHPEQWRRNACSGLRCQCMGSCNLQAGHFGCVGCRVSLRLVEPLIGQDCQAAQGAAIASSGLPRASLFISGTVNSGDCTDNAGCYTQTKTSAEAQFTTLNVTKLDMLMLDYPSSAGCDGILGQWKAFSELYNAKKVSAIAVSNFDGDQLECVTKDQNGVKPTVNQLSYSVGMSSDIVDQNAKYDIVVQAYSPLGNGGLASDPLLQTIGKQHNKTAAQVALRWILQHNATINTQSTNPQHLQQDAQIYDFSLTSEEMTKLDGHQV